MDLTSPDKAEQVLRDLSPRMLVFLDAWFGDARFNGAEAARIAGYQFPDRAAYRLLRKVEVKAEIARRTESGVITREEIVSRLRQQVTTGITALRKCWKTESGERGLKRRVLDMDKVHKLGLGHLIRKVTPTKYGDSVEMYDAQEALIRLGQTMALFAERRVLSGDQNLDELTDDQLAEIAYGKAGKRGSLN